jgi:peptidoglycan/LPS O-acetylase OafA/YrhL
VEDREAQSGRSDELNGLRGLAALSVVFYHFFSLFPPSRWTLFWKVSPFSLLTSGKGAVVIFFVLSGFALHRMLLKSVPLRYRDFALRRITRIYGPYVVALGLALAGNFWLSRGIRPNFFEWFNLTWHVPMDRTAIWQHVAFLGEYDTKLFNLAFWSLVHEMRISLIFPLLFVIVRGRSVVWSSCAVLVLLTVGAFLKAAIPKPNNLGESLHYAGLFVVGIYISEHQRRLEIWFRSQTAVIQRLFAVSALVLFCYGRFASHLFPPGYEEFHDIPVGLGAAAIIVLAFSWKPFSSLLVSKPIDWLGTRSYSLYLVHCTVLLALVNLLNLSRPNMALLPLYVAVSLIAAQVFYTLIERPSVLLSRKFAPDTAAILTGESLLRP